MDIPAVPPATMDTPVTTPNNDTVKSFLALGDSYTIGQSVEAAQTFPAQTIQQLDTSSIHFNAPQIIATTGWTTENLTNAINAASLKSKYDIVTLLIGVNNLYQGKSIDDYKLQFAALLNRAIQLAGNKKNHVFVLSIPDYSVTPFAQHSDTAKIAREIDAFNAVNKSITIGAGVPYIDITPISREAAVKPALIAADGLHPSGNQYALWAELLAAAIKKSL